MPFGPPPVTFADTKEGIFFFFFFFLCKTKQTLEGEWEGGTFAS